MGKYAQTVAIQCASCHDEFTLTARGYARRLDRYGERLLCQRCLGDVWLRTRGKHTDQYLFAGQEAVTSD